MESPSISVRRMIKSMLIWMIIPLVASILIDVSFGLLPWVTMSVSAIVIPLASVMVTRTALSEFDKVIQVVAPDEVDDDLDE